MKKILLLLAFLAIMCNIKAQSGQDQWKTNVQRVNTQGTTPPQPRYNLYVDKLNAFLAINEWKGDEIVSVKEIMIMPPSDPSDWYYFVALKTKRCLTPFIISYDLGDSNLGELFIIEPAGYPVEFRNEINKRVEAQKQSAEDLEVAKEIYGKEAVKVFKEQVVPVIVSYRRSKALKVQPRIEQTVDNLLDGYVQEDSTTLTKEAFRAKLINFLMKGDLYTYNVAIDTGLTVDTFDKYNIWVKSFIDMYVVDRKNGVTNFISKERQNCDNRIQDYYKASEDTEISKIKENMWYKKIQYLKKEQTQKNK
jgi:hypothetical protein